MSDTEKHQLAVGKDRYQMANYVSTLPAGTRILTDDLLLPFHTDNVEIMIDIIPQDGNTGGYDYYVTASTGLPAWLAKMEPVHIEGRYKLYKMP
jgi:hypothetical protein